MAMLSLLLYKAASDKHWHEALDYVLSPLGTIEDAIDRCAVAAVLGYYRRSCKLTAERADAYHIGRAARERREASPTSVVAVCGAIMTLDSPHVDGKAMARAIVSALNWRVQALRDSELRMLLRHAEDRAALLVRFLSEHGILPYGELMELLASWEDVSPDQPLLVSVVRYIANHGGLPLLEVHCVDHVMLQLTPKERRVVLELLFHTNPEAAVEAVAKLGMAEDDPTAMLSSSLLELL